MNVFNMTKENVLNLTISDYYEYADNALNIVRAYRQDEFELISNEDKNLLDKKEYDSWREFEKNKENIVGE